MDVAKSVPGFRFEVRCLGKEKHPSESAALAAMKFYQESGALRTGAGIESYQCEFCLDWHLGHTRA